MGRRGEEVDDPLIAAVPDPPERALGTTPSFTETFRPFTTPGE